MLVPGLDGLERLGEAVGHVVVLGDVHGGDVEVLDPVLEHVNTAKRPHRAPHRARVVAGEDGRCRVEIERRRMRLRDAHLLQQPAVRHYAVLHRAGRVHFRSVRIRSRQVLAKAHRVEHAAAEHDGAAGDRLVGGLMVQLGRLGQVGVSKCDESEIHAASRPT